MLVNQIFSLLSIFPTLVDVSIWTFLDLFIVLIIVLVFFRAVRGTPAIHIFSTVIICAAFFLLAKYLNLPLLRLIFKTIINTGLVALIVVFQPEIRRFLIKFGKNSPLGKNGFITRFFAPSKDTNTMLQEKIIEHISKTLVYCIAHKLGALIIFLKNEEQEFEITSGVHINGELNSKLLESIFEKQSPLHDGAVIIQSDKILSARVVLPLSENSELPVRMGLRHRSAIGITEHFDVLAIIVSEEKSTLSYAIEGNIHEHKSLDDIKSQLAEWLHL